MEVSGLRAAVDIWVMCDALDATYPSGYDELRFDVAFIPESVRPAIALHRVAVTEVWAQATTTCHGSRPIISSPGTSTGGSTTCEDGLKS